MSRAGSAPLEQAMLAAEEKWKTARWFALYTKGRHEKVVYQELTKKGIQAFLPLRKITRQWSDRKKIIEEPLFKSYLFVHTPYIDRWPILNTTGVVSFVGKKADPIEVSESDLIAVRKFIEHGIEVDPFPYLKEGQRVYIRSGAFKGVEGFVVRKDKHCRLVISLDALMQSVSVVIDESCVEPR